MFSGEPFIRKLVFTLRGLDFDVPLLYHLLKIDLSKRDRLWLQNIHKASLEGSLERME